MYTFFHWTEYIAGIRDYWYKIEDFNKDSDLFSKLELEIPEELPPVGTDSYTRKKVVKDTIHMPRYRVYTWDDLIKEDKKLGMQIKKMAKSYGYT